MLLWYLTGAIQAMMIILYFFFLMRLYTYQIIQHIYNRAVHFLKNELFEREIEKECATETEDSVVVFL